VPDIKENNIVCNNDVCNSDVVNITLEVWCSYSYYRVVICNCINLVKKGGEKTRNKRTRVLGGGNAVSRQATRRDSLQVTRCSYWSGSIHSHASLVPRRCPIWKVIVRYAYNTIHLSSRYGFWRDRRDYSFRSKTSAHLTYREIKLFLSLTKWIENSVNIYIFKEVYYKSIFHN
jgi:hypothetical protein